MVLIEENGGGRVWRKGGAGEKKENNVGILFGAQLKRISEQAKINRLHHTAVSKIETSITPYIEYFAALPTRQKRVG